MFKTLLTLAALAVTAPLAAKPIVIAHRGASGERPEHTIASYTLAIAQGADFIEPDLVSTKDGILVARHENEISGTTDVADHPAFKDRKATKTIDGEKISGWFTEDFTLAELKTLRAKERLPMLRPDNAKFDGQFQIPTFQEIIDLAKAKAQETGRRIGLYPETKHPSYFQSIGLALEEPLAAILKTNGYEDKDDPVFIQSFELANLKQLRELTGVRLIFLMSGEGGPPGDKSYAAYASPAGLAEVAHYVDGIGPGKEMIVPRGPLGGSKPATSLVADAHAAGLQVHVWTFRAENYFLPLELRKGVNPRARGDLAAELKQFAALGVDGVFSDFPAIAVATLAE
ncbi:glycerophosphodiester phosphodiesterase [Sphingobium boeckii]|uniref:glycerophosphodiester phosphodiesterase n=1 Tax=Sphingobium boeckii TaxID=1082345 RepID=A0A7W9ALA8_9SPHN|nr:glycerophosphodiester phosphodiesterase [Sphingobium boeckii]MBB5687779.1 glycerophosphoryl diester phosphodiesterase [Sphingobium boeckii]